MKLANYEIKPIVLCLPDTPEWKERDTIGLRYFANEGIEGIQVINGIHAKVWGLQSNHIYLLDGKPEENYYIGVHNVGSFLSQYVIYNCMNVMPDPHFISLETDCRFLYDDWKERLSQALNDIPPDFDFLFVGSCCAEDKEPVRIKGDLYHFPYRGEEKWGWYPQCAQCMIIAKKCVPHLIATQRDVANPPDISLMRYAFKELNVFAILPRLADQGEKTFLPK